MANYRVARNTWALLAASFGTALARASDCQDLATVYCNNYALSQCDATPHPLIALHSGAKGDPIPEWRCYSPLCLNTNHSSYNASSGCTEYCSRNEQITSILASCKLPPAPPPPVFANATEVFTPGEAGYPCIRVPSIALAGDNITLNAFAECRNFSGDGCNPTYSTRNTQASRNSNRDICQKRSTDGGLTWSPLKVIARNGAQGSPVYDDRTGKIVLQYLQLSPSDTMQMESSDNGQSWSTPRSVCGAGSLSPHDCGGAMGPGAGIQLKQGPHAGRLLYIGHFGAYVRDEVWFSDNSGVTWTGASPSLAKMDEAQVVELPNGDVLANMRTDHLNSSCKCRATARSTDGGATWGPITFDPVLTSPVCAGSILRSGDQVFFSNPSSVSVRAHGVLRRSSNGAQWKTVGLLWETDGSQCAPGSASCRTLFSSYPIDF